MKKLIIVVVVAVVGVLAFIGGLSLRNAPQVPNQPSHGVVIKNPLVESTKDASQEEEYTEPTLASASQKGVLIQATVHISFESEAEKGAEGQNNCGKH